MGKIGENMAKNNKLNFEELDDLDDYLERQVNGGMSEAALFNDYENYESEYHEDEEDYNDGQLYLEVIDRSEVPFFGSDKTSFIEYTIRTEEGIYNELLPEQNKDRQINENEVPCITYRKSINPEIPNQFLLSVFNKNNYDLPAWQKTIDIVDDNIRNQVINVTAWYDRIKAEEKISKVKNQNNIESLSSSEIIIVNGIPRELKNGLKEGFIKAVQQVDELMKDCRMLIQENKQLRHQLRNKSNGYSD